METQSANPYLEGPYAPVQEEIVARDLVASHGEIPKDLAGTFVRNGANPKLPPKGRYHWFDGDGMVHGITFENGKATYRNRFVRTKGLLAEIEAGKPLWTGILEPIDLSNPGGPFKNTANTDLVFHAGKLLALWWQSGVPYNLRLSDLETCGRELFGKEHKPGISAHPKVDPRTGEMLFMTFGIFPPYLSYGVIDAKGELVHFTPIHSVPGPRYQHDIAITAQYTILMDLPMYPDPEMLKVGKSRVKFFRDQPSRFGLIPRRGTDADVKWFEASPSYVYHTINAWEEGDEVVMVGCHIADPLMGDPTNPERSFTVPSIGLQRLEPYLHEWRFNLKTGKTTERQLSDVMIEFPRMDNRLLGEKSRYSFNPKVASEPTVVFEGLVKHDFSNDTEIVHRYPEGWSAGEAVVCPRAGSTGEDDAYVVSFAIEHATGKSELWIWSARDFGPPLARVPIPQRVPAGYHAWWISEEDAKKAVTE
ncbi:MAG: carotenoid oxygenase family protein [Labilithrix sp.]